MFSALEWLLLLYPAEYKLRFGDEMLDVLRQSLNEANRRSKWAVLALSVRECLGLLSGAINEHLRECFGNHHWFAGRRLHMRSEFRYPRATAPLMLVIFAAIIFAIYRARAVALKAEISVSTLPSVPLTFGAALLVAALAGAAGWLVLYSLRRSGVHRLSEAQTWPQVK